MKFKLNCGKLLENIPFCNNPAELIDLETCFMRTQTPQLITFLENNMDQVGEGEETRSGTEKRCSHNLQSGHPAWWSADNYSIFPTVNILEARIEANRHRKSEMLKKLKKIISCNFVFLAYRICLSVLKCGETKTQPC